jgi:hypothetical protein
LALITGRLDWAQLLEKLMATRDEYENLEIMSRERAMRAQNEAEHWLSEAEFWRTEASEWRQLSKSPDPAQLLK